MICNLQDALIVIREQKETIEDLNKEVEKCYAEIADKDAIIAEIWHTSNGCHNVRICGMCGDTFISDGNDCCIKCL